MSEESKSDLYEEAISWLYDIGCDEVVSSSIRPFYGLRVKLDDIDDKYEESFSSNTFNLEHISNILELENYIKPYFVKNFNVTSSKLVFFDGNKDADLLIVGDSPDASDIKIGKPFKGEAGELLDAMLKAINYDRDNTFFANVNYNDSSVDIKNSLLVIKKIISIIKPKVIIMFGSEATKALTNINHGIFNTRGKWFNIENKDLNIVIPGISMFHPRYVLMHPESKKESWADLKSVRQKLS